MALSPLGRKHLLGHGAQHQIAFRNAVPDSVVSWVVNGEKIPVTEIGWKRYRKIQKAVARKLGLSYEEAFSPEERGVSEETQKDAA